MSRAFFAINNAWYVDEKCETRNNIKERNKIDLDVGKCHKYTIKVLEDTYQTICRKVFMTSPSNC